MGHWCLALRMVHTLSPQVLSGYNVVKAIEACGSKPRGETSYDVIIANCGEVSKPASGAATTTACLIAGAAALIGHKGSSTAQCTVAPRAAIAQMQQQRRAALRGMQLPQRARIGGLRGSTGVCMALC